MASREIGREGAEREIAFNRKALHDYHVLEQIEAGIALQGTEIKSLREGNVNVRDSYASVDRGEIWLLNLHVGPYSHTGYASHEATRPRKLLLHRRQISALTGKVAQTGITLVPLRLYFKGSKVKVLLALARGKQLHDKRESIRRREIDRETRAAVKAGSRR